MTYFFAWPPSYPKLFVSMGATWPALLALLQGMLPLFLHLLAIFNSPSHFLPLIFVLTFFNSPLLFSRFSFFSSLSLSLFILFFFSHSGSLTPPLPHSIHPRHPLLLFLFPSLSLSPSSLSRSSFTASHLHITLLLFYFHVVSFNILMICHSS